MLHVICIKLCPGLLSICVGDSSQHSGDIVKKKESRIVPLNAIIIIKICTMFKGFLTNLFVY